MSTMKKIYMKNSIPENRVIIFSAPSGSGKTTVVKHLLERHSQLGFSVSATSRPPRGTEKDGKDYFFFTASEFLTAINEDKFVEYEEVYKGYFYGTLKSEVERIWREGKVILFDIDVKGGVNLKKLYGERSLSVFVKAPSIEVLKKRLTQRGTDSPEAVNKRLIKAEYELSFESMFDKVIINDNLAECLSQADKIVEEFLSCNI
jgi:guanylate kinase